MTSPSGTMIRAIHFPGYREFRDRALAGSIHVEDRGGVTYLWYCCPCGCGMVGRLPVARERKPAASPGWRWNGSVTEPTLHPSVHHIGHWHGWLRDGYWSAV